jgi:predicted transcriptional regulator of viral defense system
MHNIREFYPMPKSITNARQLFAKHRNILRTRQALKLGIHPRTLYALHDQGELECVSRGLYRLASAPPLTSPDWVAITLRVPRAVICLISALAHYGLTTQVPHAIDIALPSHAQIPQIDNPPIRVFWFSKSAYSTGIETITIDDVPIRIYSQEKTIADCFKYRNKAGLDIAIEALRAYRAKYRRPNRAGLIHYAQVCRVERVMRPYLEAIL